MKTAVIAVVLISAAHLVSAQVRAQDPGVLADIDEAFRLAGVRSILETLPSHVGEMTAAAVAQFPKAQRSQFEPVIQDVSLKFLDPDAFYRQLRAYFAKHYDARHMQTFLALEKTPVYRTMHRLEETASSPVAQAARRRFEMNMKSDPPDAKRIDAIQRLDDARNTTGLQVKIVIGIVNAMADGLGAQMPADLEAQSTVFAAKVRPILAANVLHSYLFAFRNSDNLDLEDYVAAAQQKDVDWFNRNLQGAILAVAADRSARAGEYIKSKVAQPLN
jgi:hypothetical protein